MTDERASVFQFSSTTAAVKMCDCHRCGQAIYENLVHHCGTALLNHFTSDTFRSDSPWAKPPAMYGGRFGV